MTDLEKKAFKLVEALAQKCDTGDRDGDHAWRECRRCLAANEFDGAPKQTRELMQALLSLRTVWMENCEPFIDWAQKYLDGGRWGGHDVFDAIKTELLERDGQVQRWQDIATAPKGDRLQVVVLRGGERTMAHRWGDMWLRDDDGCKCNPTHWIPLPDPPSFSQQGEDVIPTDGKG